MQTGPRLLLWLLVLSASPAMAKDLPRSEPDRKTTGCEWAGAGFSKVEGGSTCIKIGGAVRAEFGTTTATSASFAPKLGR